MGEIGIIVIILIAIGLMLILRSVFIWWSGINELITESKATNETLREIKELLEDKKGILTDELGNLSEDTFSNVETNDK